jgi:hypothetical protein
VLDDALKHVARFFDPTNIDEKNIFFFRSFTFSAFWANPFFQITFSAQATTTAPRKKTLDHFRASQQLHFLSKSILASRLDFQLRKRSSFLITKLFFFNHIAVLTDFCGHAAKNRCQKGVRFVVLVKKAMAKSV